MLNRDELGPLKPFHTKIRPQILEFLKGEASIDGKYLYRVIEDALLCHVGSQAALHPDFRVLAKEEIADFIDYGTEACLCVAGEYDGSWPDTTEEERLVNAEAGDEEDDEAA